MSLDERREIDLNRFNTIIDEYSASFQNPPKSTSEIVQFCKDRQYNYKYGQLNPLFSLWQKQRATATPKPTPTETTNATPPNDINWDLFWDEYTTKYQYPPKNAVHLWNFAKEEKFVSVKYRTARTAFDRMVKERALSTIEGRTRSGTDLGTKNLNKTKDANEQKKECLKLRVTKKTSSEDLEQIKAKYTECLEAFRRHIMHDPRSALQLFNFINESMPYTVRYGDVKKCHQYAVKHKWFLPMRRKMKKKKVVVVKEKEDENEGSADDHAESEGEGNGVYELEVDEDALKEDSEEEKKEVIVYEMMSDDQYDHVLAEYNVKYHNPPRNASQIMNFAKEIDLIFKYKACRIAFNRWKQCRGSVMPKMEDKEEKVAEPGSK